MNDINPINLMNASYASRLAAVRQRLQQDRLDALLLTSRENNRYLSGFSGTESWLLVTAADACLLVDFRYTEQAAGQCPASRIIDYTRDRLGSLAELIRTTGCSRLGIEEDNLSWGLSRQLQERLPAIVLEPAQAMLDELRSVKDDAEVALISRALEIAEAALQEILPAIRPGQTETAIAARLEHAMRSRGASGPSFTTIVASGPRSALPHGVASDRAVQAGEAIVIDFGCIWQGYCSDMTRTIFLGEPSGLARQVYGIVLDAHLAAAAVLRAGLTGSAADTVARQIITDAGFGPHFGHGLGHGVGLAIHESPRLAQTNPLPLRSGQIVTVEPGIYLPGQFGVRIEDMALILPAGSGSGSRNLNQMSKALTVLPLID